MMLRRYHEPVVDEDAVERPAKSAKVADWRAYADAVGIDYSGLSKDELIGAVEKLDEPVEVTEDEDPEVTEDEDPEVTEDEDPEVTDEDETSDGDIDEDES